VIRAYSALRAVFCKRNRTLAIGYVYLYVCCQGVKGFVAKIGTAKLTSQTAGAIFGVRQDFVFRHRMLPFANAGVALKKYLCLRLPA
jgi:hypothetical protein